MNVVTAMAMSMLSLHAASQSNGNYTVSASENEAGDLTVQGEAHFHQGIDFGTTATNLAAGTLNYGENESVYTISLSATRPSAGFLWLDNGMGSPNNKMLLGADNSLSLFNASGTANIILNPTTGLITLAGSSPGICLPDGTILSSAKTSALYASSGSAVANVTADGKVNFANGITLGTNNVASGPASFSSGSNASATGAMATAFGYSAVASGYASTAFGYMPSASGAVSTALGQQTSASGNCSTALGFVTKTSGDFSTAMGYYTIASGPVSTAFGQSCIASGGASTAFGDQTTASGGVSTALGYNTRALGAITTALGESTTAQAFDSLVIGRFNIIQGNTTGWVATDDLFVIGNGSSDSARSNALVVKKNGDAVVSGALRVNGAVRIPPQGDLAMGDFTADPESSSNVGASSGETLTTSNTPGTGGTLTLGNSSGVTNAGAGTLNLMGNNAIVSGGTISTGGLTLTGAGTLNLSGNLTSTTSGSGEVVFGVTQNSGNLTILGAPGTP